MKNKLITNMYNIKLKTFDTYQRNDRWFMRATYSYEDSNGAIKEIIIPKIECPLVEFGRPIIECEVGDYGSLPFSECSIIAKPTLSLYKDNVTFVNEKKQSEEVSDVYYVDRVIKKPVKEMTIEEIEQELGYSIKIVK